MFEKRRTERLALLGMTALILGLGVAAPAFAWHITALTTQTGYIDPSGAFVASTSFPVGTNIADKAVVTGYPSDNLVGSVTFKLYSNDGCTGTAISSDTKSVPSANPATVISDKFTVTTAGSYSFKASFTGSGAWAGVTYTGSCEPFTLTSLPPPPTVPQFPLGMALLFALTIPALLLIRSKFSSPSLKM